jgi:hypothetical protein
VNRAAGSEAGVLPSDKWREGSGQTPLSFCLCRSSPPGVHVSFNKVPTIDQEKTPTNRTQLVGTAVLLGVVATLWGYEYGTHNQTEYVLAAERLLESGFLSSDFFTNTTTSFGPRSYFIQLVALLATVAPLPAVFFCLALAANATTSAVTALAGNNLFGSPLAGALAACMVLGLDTLRLGEAAYLTMPYLVQATLAMPLALCAIWAALRGHVVAAALASGIASLLHPVIGGGVGGVVLAASTTIIILTGIRHAASNSRSRMAIGSLILGWLVFISLFSLNVLPYASMGRIDSSELSHILVIFRAPHHYLPSSFPRRDYLYAASFLAATLLAWHTVSSHSAALREVWRVAQLMIGVVLLGCLGGYLFVEVTPTRSLIGWGSLAPRQ